MKIETQIKTKKTHIIKLNGEQIIDLVFKQLQLMDNKPSGIINCTFKVPGGADWSGMQIDIDDDYPVTIKWERNENE